MRADRYSTTGKHDAKLCLRGDVRVLVQDVRIVTTIADHYHYRRRHLTR